MTKRPRIGILGGKGFLGSNLVDYFEKQGYHTTAIGKDNYRNLINYEFDIIINANGNSKKYWANQHPEADYEASVISVQNAIRDFKFDKYFFISSSDVYPDHQDPIKTAENQAIDRSRLEPYGLHKLQAEELVKKLPNYVILRCSAIVGPNLKKGLIKDILDSTNLFVTLDSQLQFIDAFEVGKIVEYLLKINQINQIFNCGGKGSVTVSEILKIFGKQLNSRKEAKKQKYEIDVSKLDKLIILKTSEEYLKKFYEEQK